MALTTADVDALRADGNPNIVAVAPIQRQDVTAIGDGGASLAVELVLTSSEYAEVHGSAVASGAFFTPDQDSSGTLVSVIGADVAEQLFGDLDPVGRTVRVSIAGGRITFDFVVGGVLAKQNGASEANGQMFAPLSALLGRIRAFVGPGGSTPVSQIDVRTIAGADDETVKMQITDLLLFVSDSTEPDFVVSSQDDLIGAATEVSNALSILLGSVAGISLLVGGIGVMNIMLVSVTERTREIGIRRAVGATGRDVVLQFVAEAVALSLVGALVGVLLGAAISLGVNGRDVAGQPMTTVIQPWSVALAVVVAALVGLISGSYPAYRATVLDPIVALRSE
jgi:putative ABC transport system permease protein